MTNALKCDTIISSLKRGVEFMKKVDEQRHFLALLKRPGDYVFIAISKLDIANGIPRISLDISFLLLPTPLPGFIPASVI